jgi:hypothetical protein
MINHTSHAVGVDPIKHEVVGLPVGDPSIEPAAYFRRAPARSIDPSQADPDGRHAIETRQAYFQRKT